MSEEQIRESKHNLCVKCGEHHCCRRMESCKDVNDYILERKNMSDLTHLFNRCEVVN